MAADNSNSHPRASTAARRESRSTAERIFRSIMTESPQSQSQSHKQALRLKRSLIASTTYALGLMILVLCSAVGLLSTAHLSFIALAFVLINIASFTVFRSGWNLHFKDPSLTQAQVFIAASMVALI